MKRHRILEPRARGRLRDFAHLPFLAVDKPGRACAEADRSLAFPAPGDAADRFGRKHDLLLVSRKRCLLRSALLSRAFSRSRK